MKPRPHAKRRTGTAQQVTFPWCEGSGVQLPEHDAQAARSARDIA